MSIKVRNACRWLKVQPAEKAALMAMAGYARDDGSRVYPSLEKLELETCFSNKTLRRAIEGLERLAVLVPKGPNKGGRKTSNRYDIDLIRVAALTAEPGAEPDETEDHNPVNMTTYSAAESTDNPVNVTTFNEPAEPENVVTVSENVVTVSENPVMVTDNTLRNVLKEERELQATLYCANGQPQRQRSPKVNDPRQTELEAWLAETGQAGEPTEPQPVELAAEPITSPAPVVGQPAAGAAVVLYLAADRGRRTKATGDANFDEFYAAYPRHISRKDAAGAYANALKGGATHAAIMQGVAALLTHLETFPDFPVPYPATWLNGERWGDDLKRGNRFGGQGNGRNHQGGNSRNGHSSTESSREARRAGIIDGLRRHGLAPG